MKYIQNHHLVANWNTKKYDQELTCTLDEISIKSCFNMFRAEYSTQMKNVGIPVIKVHV